MTIKAPRKTRRSTKFARGSAAAFAVGLFLAAPQAGVAGADTGDDTASASAADAGQAAGKGAAGRGEGRSPDAATPERARAAARSVGAAEPRPAAAAARTPRSAATVAARIPTVRPAESQSESTAAVPEVSVPVEGVALTVPTVTDTVDPVTDAVDPLAEDDTAAVLSETLLSQTWSEAVPVATMAAPAVAAPAPVTAVSMAQGAVNGFFEALADGLASLPEGDFTTTLEGALLLVRRTLFNQAPIATPIQTSVASTGEILGSLAGRDPDGDAVTYSVVTGPQFGTVEVAEDGSYTYTPGDGYTGSDSFTVRMDGDASGFNIFSPGGHAVTDVQVLVGAGAPTDPFAGSAAHQDPLDAALHLENASAQVTVAKTNGRFTASVALTNVTAQTQVVWMDATGRSGQVSLTDLATNHWQDYADAAEANGGVTLGVVFAGTGGATQALVLTDVHATENADGQIVLTGNLAPDAASNPGYQDDFWDVVGIGHKAEYERFRQQYVEVANFAPVSLAVTGADLFADTYSLSDYKSMKTAGDQGIRLTDLSVVQNSAAAQNLSTSKSGLVAGGACTNCTATGFKVEVTSQLDDPSGLIVGLDDGSVRQWTTTVLADGSIQNGWKILRAGAGSAYKALDTPTAWQPYTTSAVTAMAHYGNGFVIGTQSGQVEQWTGTEWKTLGKTADGVSVVLPYKSGLLIGSTSWSASGTGSAENARTQIAEWDGQNFTTIANWGDNEGSLVNMITYRNGTVPVVTTTDNTLRQWDGNSWTTLPETDFEGTVTAMMALKDSGGDGFVVGEATFGSGGSGSLTQWTGTEWKDLGSLTSAVTAFAPVSFSGETTSFVFGLEDGTMKVSYVKADGQRGVYQLRDGQGFGSIPVKTIIPAAANSAFTVGLADGAVWQFNGDLASALLNTSSYSGWTLLRKAAVISDDGLYGSSVGGHGVGSSQWSWSGFAGIPSKFNAGTGNASLIATSDGFALVVNQKNGTIGGAFGTGKITDALVSLYVSDGLLQVDDKGTAATTDDEVKTDAAGTAITGPGWLEVQSSNVSSLSQDLLKQGVTFAEGINGFKTGSGTTATSTSTLGYGTTGILGTSDPLFGPSGFAAQNLPACLADKTCTGTFKTFSVVGNPEYPTPLVKKNFLVGAKNTDPKAGGGSYGGTGTTTGTNISNQSMDVALDLKPTVYGYIFSPDGLWDAMSVKKYSMAAMVAAGVGPSFNLRLGGRSDGVIDVLREPLLDFRPVSITLPYGVGIFAVNAGLDATLRLTLDLPDNYQTLPWYRNQLSAWARVTSGMLVSYNTAASANSDAALTGDNTSKWRISTSAYFDYSFDDFAAVQGLTVSPSLIPYVDMSVGLDAPKGSPWPFSEGASLYRVAVGYENPLSINLNYPKDGAGSQTLSSSGNVTFQAGVLEGLGIPGLKNLTYKSVYPVYSLKTDSVPLPFS